MLVGIISRLSSITSRIPTCTHELWLLNCPKLGFPLSKSKSFHPVIIKLSEYIGGNNISTKFYNQPNPTGTPEIWPLNCPKLRIPLSKSNTFYPVFIKLGEYVGGHNISSKFYDLPNPPLLNYGPWIVQILNKLYLLQSNILLPKCLSIPLNLPQIRRAYFVSVWHSCCLCGRLSLNDHSRFINTVSLLRRRLFFVCFY